MYNTKDTICAISTPAGSGAISLIRISGNRSFQIIKDIFKSKKEKSNIFKKSHQIFFGKLKNGKEIIDEVLVFIYKSPNTYTAENMVEISCHGSSYIQQKIIELLIDKGCRLAHAGEFTYRAFLNGKFDLSQSEAVADLIAAQSQAAHGLALQQMRGGYSSKLKELRKELLDFASLLELELDFSEEDLEFADRTRFQHLLFTIKAEVEKLIKSFKAGNVIKNGIPVAIIGKTNVGKSTLINTLLHEDKAIVSDIHGTTRDVIEDSIFIDGIQYRFYDTAGLRDSDEEIEILGIKKTYKKIKQAAVILFVFDVNEQSQENVLKETLKLENYVNDDEKVIILIANKSDLSKKEADLSLLRERYTCIIISAKHKQNIDEVFETLKELHISKDILESVTVSNTRHYEALLKVDKELKSIKRAFKIQLPSDLIASHVRTALHYLGTITGEVSTEELLGNIFERFCVGK